MNGYADNNRLNVKRTVYGSKINADATGVHQPNNRNERSNNVQDRVGAVQRNRVPAERERGVQTRESGFVYVEHSGVKGTIKDVFCTRRKHSKEKSCFDKVVMILVFAVLMFFVAGSYCEYNDAFNRISELESQNARYQEEKTKLIVAIEERNEAIDIDKYATETLGMVRQEKLTRQYVNISGKDVVEVNYTESNDESSDGLLLSGFKNVITNVIGRN